MTEETEPELTEHEARIAASDALARHLAHLPRSAGAGAVPELRGALAHPEPWVRLHAVEGLAGIDTDEGRAALVQALHDPSFGVHWEAGRALCAAGRHGVIAVLRALVRDAPSTGFLHGAAFVLRHAHLTQPEREAVMPVIQALQRPAADLEAPVLAYTALQRLAPGAVSRSDRPRPWYEGLHRRRVRRSGATPVAAESAP
jgi:HEAT repeat protein